MKYPVHSHQGWKRPQRSPFEVPELLRRFYEGRTVVEIGCGAGDLAPGFARYAAHYSGYEMSADHAELGRQRFRQRPKISIYSEAVDPDNLPDADFYYFWFGVPEEHNLFVDALEKRGATATLALFGGIVPQQVPDTQETRRVVAECWHYYSEFRCQESLERFADEVILFRPREPDGRSVYERVEAVSDSCLVIKYF